MNEANKKRIGIGIALAGLAGVAVYFFVVSEPTFSGDRFGEIERAEKGNPDDSDAQETSPKVKPPRITKPKDTDRGEVQVHDIAQTALQLHQADTDPTEDLEILRNLLDFYRRINGANPEGGLNFEIVEKLTGTNEKNLALLGPDHPSLNGEGELVDRWGTPYWFHPVSRDLMEIVSAGPDKNLWTEDDVRIE